MYFSIACFQPTSTFWWGSEIDTTEYSNGFHTENITDAWVSINGIDKGIYELPATFPVLDNGNVEIHDTPGWGIEINPDWLENADYKVSVI